MQRGARGGTGRALDDYGESRLSLCHGWTQDRETQTAAGLDSAHDRGARYPGARLIGELAVDRESVRRALREDPDSLQVILDELLHALQRETTGTAARLESADAMCYGFPREI